MADKNITIRPYQPSDKAMMLELFRLNIPAYFSKEEEQGFSNYLDNELELYYVIEMNGALVGCGGINFEDDKKTGIISWDIIHPDHHGKSLGSRLVKHRLDVLHQIPSVTLIRVRTAQFTEGFYSKHGFKLTEIIRDYWAPGYHLYRMEMVPGETNYRLSHG